MSFLNNNMETIDMDIELNSLSRITLSEAEKLIDGYHKSIGIDFKLEEIIKDGTFDIIKNK